MDNEARVLLERELHALLKRGMRTAEQVRGPLQAAADAACLAARVDVSGDVLVVSQIVGTGGGTTIDRFELDARPPDARPPGPQSAASRERGARKQAEDALIGGFVDALELRYRSNQGREQARGESGLLYDLLNIGAQTVRELLHLNARANRRLLAAMRTLTEADHGAGDVVVTASGEDGAALHLSPGAEPVALWLENHRNGELTIDLPREVSVCLADGTGARTLALRCAPGRSTLARGERRSIEVGLAEALPGGPTSARHLGEMMLGTDAGGVARVPVILDVPLPGAKP